MNKKQELLYELGKALKHDMPIHTRTTADIPHVPFGPLPKKSIMDISARIDNKFLNTHQALIEELDHIFPKNTFVRKFVNYQKKYFGNYDILNHDNFFKSRFHDGYRKHLSPNFTETRMIGNMPYVGNVLGFGTIVDTLIQGTEVFTTTSETSAGTGLNSNRLGASIFAGTPTNGGTYNQIATHIDTFANTGNYRLGVADDNSAPDNIYSGSDTGSIAVPTLAEYNYQDRKSTRLNSSHIQKSRMPSSA